MCENTDKCPGCGGDVIICPHCGKCIAKQKAKRTADPDEPKYWPPVLPELAPRPICTPLMPDLYGVSLNVSDWQEWWDTHHNRSGKDDDAETES